MIDRFSSERKGELPTPEQLEEYYELLRHTLHTIGRGIRRTSNYPGKEGLLPGWLDTLDGDSESLRQRSYAASMRRLGETGAALAVAENDHTLLPNPQGGVRWYSTFRALYKFTWDNRIGVYESRARVFDIISPARSDAEVLPRRADDAAILALDHEQTAPDTFRYDHGWLAVYDSDVDGLLRRTEEYSEGLIAVHTK